MFPLEIRKTFYRFLWVILTVFGIYNQHELSLSRWGTDIYRRGVAVEILELAGFVLVALVALFCLYWFLHELGRRNKWKTIFIVLIYSALTVFFFTLKNHFSPIERIKPSTILFLVQLGVAIMLTYGMVAPFWDRRATGTVAISDTGGHDHDTPDLPAENQGT